MSPIVMGDIDLNALNTTLYSSQFNVFVLYEMTYCKSPHKCVSPEEKFPFKSSCLQSVCERLSGMFLFLMQSTATWPNPKGNGNVRNCGEAGLESLQ